jgi:hypothetical protein
MEPILFYSVATLVYPKTINRKMNHAYKIYSTTLNAQTLFRFLKKIVRKYISDSSGKGITNEESPLHVRIIEHTMA